VGLVAEDRRVCLLTGAGGTFGTEFCRRYGSRYAIAAVHRRRVPDVPTQHVRHVDPLDPGAPADDGAVFAIRSDLLLDGEVERVVELALARFGRVDVLVNAAVHSIWGSLVDGDAVLRSAEEQFKVNVLLPLRLASELVERHWRDRAAENRARRRHVVNLSSLAGIYVFPGQGQSVYGASKAALNLLSSHMAGELARIGVRVNALAPDAFPGIVATEDVADAVVDLDDGDATGQLLVLDRTGRHPA
jgi:NAD(P)-dependent dehydrogenase (short-subunit alcohol dehydrogenase family)